MIRRFRVIRRLPGQWMWITYRPGCALLEWHDDVYARCEIAAEVWGRFQPGTGYRWWWRCAGDTAPEDLTGYRSRGAAMDAAQWARIVLTRWTAGLTPREREAVSVLRDGGDDADR